jgi:hypothetical protein
MTTLRKFVDGLAEELGVSEEARKKWWQRRRGVPLRWRRPVIALAAKRLVSLDWDDLDEGEALDRQPKVQNVPGNARVQSSSGCEPKGRAA